MRVLGLNSKSASRADPDVIETKHTCRRTLCLSESDAALNHTFPLTHREYATQYLSHFHDMEGLPEIPMLNNTDAAACLSSRVAGLLCMHALHTSVMS